MADEHNHDALTLATASTAEISTWTDEKREKLISTFDERTVASRYIMGMTSIRLMSKALNRKYIGTVHYNQLYTLKETYGDQEQLATRRLWQELSIKKEHYSYRTPETIGGRSVSSLDEIVEQKVNQIFRQIPSLAQVTVVLDPECSAKLTRIDELTKKSESLKLKVDELGGSLSMDDFPNDMTLGVFRKEVKKRIKQRKELAEKLTEVMEEIIECDRFVEKRLYRGIPDLAKVIVKTAKKYWERCIAFGATQRRVQEHVRFGDSDAAIGLLKGFEKDESTVSEDIKNEFAEALQNLQLKKAKPRKRIAKKSK